MQFAVYAVVYLAALTTFVYFTAVSIAQNPNFVILFPSGPVVTDPTRIYLFFPTVLVGMAVFIAVPLILLFLDLAKFPRMIAEGRVEYEPGVHPHDWSIKTMEIVIPVEAQKAQR